MKYFIDSCNLKEIDSWIEKLGNSYAGITTNFSMIRGKDEIFSFLNSIENEEKYKKIMIQIFYEEELEILNKTGNIYVAKISMIEKLFPLINKVSIFNKEKAATTCYDIVQINQAIEMNMDYTMVYYAKNDYKGLLEDAVRLKKNTGSNIKLVAASIRNKEQVTHAINTGIEYVTVKPSVLEKLFNNEDAIKEIE